MKGVQTKDFRALSRLTLSEEYDCEVREMMDLREFMTDIADSQNYLNLDPAKCDRNACFSCLSRLSNDYFIIDRAEELRTELETVITDPNLNPFLEVLRQSLVSAFARSPDCLRVTASIVEVIAKTGPKVVSFFFRERTLHTVLQLIANPLQAVNQRNLTDQERAALHTARLHLCGAAIGVIDTLEIDSKAEFLDADALAIIKDIMRTMLDPLDESKLHEGVVLLAHRFLLYCVYRNMQGVDSDVESKIFSTALAVAMHVPEQGNRCALPVIGVMIYSCPDLMVNLSFGELMKTNIRSDPIETSNTSMWIIGLMAPLRPVEVKSALSELRPIISQKLRVGSKNDRDHNKFMLGFCKMCRKLLHSGDEYVDLLSELGFLSELNMLTDGSEFHIVDAAMSVLVMNFSALAFDVQIGLIRQGFIDRFGRSFNAISERHDAVLTFMVIVTTVAEKLPIEDQRILAAEIERTGLAEEVRKNDDIENAEYDMEDIESAMVGWKRLRACIQG